MKDTDTARQEEIYQGRINLEETFKKLLTETYKIVKKYGIRLGNTPYQVQSMEGLPKLVEDSTETHYLEILPGISPRSVDPTSLAARIQFLDEDEEVTGCDLLEKTGGYVRFRENVIGVITDKQLRKLKRRRILFNTLCDHTKG